MNPAATERAEAERRAAIGARIRERRGELGLSQAQLAERLGLKHKSNIAQYENGHAAVGRSMVRRLAEALECSEERLTGGALHATDVEAVRRAAFAAGFREALARVQGVVQALEPGDPFAFLGPVLDESQPVEALPAEPSRGRKRGGAGS